MTPDPNLWLEDVTGDKALDWVRAQNAVSQKALTADPGFETLRGDLRAILDSDARIPAIEKIGGHYYNFWRDKAHPAGLWRRTTLAEYRKPQPAWETVIDLDAINAAEKANWFWHGVDCLKPDGRHCLVALSRGGSDADITREFDLSTKTWVAGGFERPEAKGSLTWRDADSVYVATDFGEGSMTTSGYARIVKLWTRGTPMASATTVYEGKPEDLGVAAYRDHTPGFERDFVWRGIAFYNNELYLRGADGALRKIDAPNSANKGVHRQYLTLQLREPLTEGGTTYPAGSLLAADFDAYMAGKREYTVLFTPTDSASLADATWTRDHLLLNVLDDVKSRIEVLTPDGKGDWARTALPGTQAIGDLQVAAVDDETSNAYFLTATSFLSPTSLSLAEVGDRKLVAVRK
jgi:prolyl oligopeptidase